MTTANNALLSELPVPIELCDPTLGRMLARRLSLAAFRQILKIPRDGISTHAFAARFFAIVAKSIPNEAPVAREAYDAGAPIDASAFAALSLVVRLEQMVPIFAFFVAPAKAGVRGQWARCRPPPVQARGRLWVPAFAGMTG
jgi:hypothetical protein